MPKSFLTKVVILVSSAVLGTILGNGCLIVILWILGLQESPGTTLLDLMAVSDSPKAILLGIGMNHVMTFVGSAAIYWALTREQAFAKYFQLDKKPNFQLAGLFVLLLFASYPIIGASGLVTEYIELPSWLQKMSDGYSDTISQLFVGKDITTLILNLLVLAVLPAIGEELIFRGIIQKELHRVIANPHFVVVITSVLFSAIHLQADGFLPKLIISLILCYAYYWSGSLWYPIAIHFVNNSLMTFALYFKGEDLETLQSADTPEFPWLGVIFSLFLCGLVIRTIKEHLNHNEVDQNV